MLTWPELFTWKADHPDEPLIPLARFEGQVYLVRYESRSWVETPCGYAGPARLHALVFKLPREAVDCEKCKALAKGGYDMLILLIPDHDPDEPKQRYPGNIAPGQYTGNEVVRLLRTHADNPEAVKFIADMLEE